MDAEDVDDVEFTDHGTYLDLDPRRGQIEDDSAHQPSS